jgi:hypothetical protein
MRIRRWALPFDNLPMHPTCAVYSICPRHEGCQSEEAYTSLLCSYIC